MNNLVQMCRTLLRYADIDCLQNCNEIIPLKYLLTVLPSSFKDFGIKSLKEGIQV